MSSSGYRIQTPELEEEKEEARTEVKGEGKEEGSSGILGPNTKDNQPIDVKPTTITASATTKSKKSNTTAVPAKQASLKSFFTFQSQPKSAKASTSSSSVRIESSSSITTETTRVQDTKSRTSLQQLHLVPVRHTSSSSSSSSTQLQTKRPSLLTTCPKCNMSYIRGGTGGTDDATHKAHCTRVTEGVRWDPRASSTAVAGGSVTMTGGKLASWRSRRKGGGSCVVVQGVEFGKGKGKAKEERVGNVVCVEGYEAVADKRVRLPLRLAFPTRVC